MLPIQSRSRWFLASISIALLALAIWRLDSSRVNVFSGPVDQGHNKDIVDVNIHSNDQIPDRLNVEQLKNFGNIPLHFEKNLGQADSRVKFVARGNGYNLSLSATGAAFALRQPSNILANTQVSTKTRRQLSPARQPVVQMQVVGANQLAPARGVGELVGKTNYFIGSNPTKWRTNVPNYDRVRFDDVYEGIDLEYYGNQRELEFDFIIKPHVSADLIKLRFAGVNNIEITGDGDLIVASAGVALKQQKPIVYQVNEKGERIEVACSYRINEDKLVSFSLAEYDRTKELVIDPTVVYTTYLGGTGNDAGFAIAADANGNAYITGQTSGSFPLVSALQTSYGGGTSDIFISKFNSLGTAYVYTTYFGGTGRDVGKSVAVDSSGNAYITGETDSATTFPRLNARQSVYGGGTNDAFLTKLNATGSQIVYSTFHGGPGNDLGKDVVVDVANNAYVTGVTTSPASTFPILLPPGETSTFNGGANDAFVSKFKSVGSQFVYSRYYGGSGDDEGRGIAVNVDTGQACVTGLTTSANLFFDTGNVYQGGTDAFLVTLRPFGEVLRRRYFGGSGFDTGNDVTLQGTSFGGHIGYIVGETSSSTLPIYSNARQETNGGGSRDGFLAIFFEDLFVNYGTFIGGNGYDSANGVAADAQQDVYITGSTDSNNFPLVAAQQPFNRGGRDAFVVKSRGSLFGYNPFLYSSYTGGGGTDEGRGVATDPVGNVYLVGETTSTNLLLSNAKQPNPGGANDVFVSKLVSIQDTYRVSGRLTNPMGQGVQVPVRATGNDIVEAIPDPNGNYQFNLPRYGSYVVTPQVINHTISPPNYQFNPLIGNQTNRNFLLTALNDNFASAVTITGLSGNVLTNNAGATLESGEPSNGERSIWYKWRPTVAVRMLFRSMTIFQSPGVNVSIYTGTNFGDLVQVPDFDNVDNEVLFQATANTDYWIALTENNSPIQDTNLSWSEGVVISGNLNIIPNQGITRGFDIYATDQTTFERFRASRNNTTYNVSVPRGRTYRVEKFSSENVVTNPSDYFLPNLTSDSTGNDFDVLFPLSITITGRLGITDLVSPTAPIVTCAFGDVTASPNPTTREYTFQCAAIPPGTSFTVTPSLSGYTFTPNSIPVTTQVSNNPSLTFSTQQNSCNFTFSPTSPQSFGGEGGSRAVMVTTTAGCQISAVGSEDWITVTNIFGNTVNYSVAPNNSTSARQGKLIISGRDYVINQSGIPARFSISDALSMEGDSGLTTFSFAINRTGRIDNAVSVNFSTANGSAIAGQDYVQRTNQTVNFAAFETQKIITIDVIGDVNTEPNENFQVNLSSPTGGAIIDISSATGAIVNDDGLTANPATSFDFDGDSKADVSVFRPSVGYWYILNSTNGSFRAESFGVATDKIAPGDYDNDSKTDVVVFRPSNGYWYLLNSGNNDFTWMQFGASGDLPVPADYDVDGRTDIAVFRPSVGTFYILQSTNSQVRAQQWGQNGDIPVPADYDGDGKPDIAVFRPSAGAFYILRSIDNSFLTVQWGTNGDKPVPGDYDGDRRADLAVFRPLTGAWYILRSTDNGVTGMAWGTNGDQPTAGDYDGDGRWDIAVFRPSSGTFYIYQSMTNTLRAEPFGVNGDVPVASAFVP